MCFGDLLKDEREKQNLSKYRLAKLADVSEMAITHWERGERTMNIDAADRIFKALGISVTIGKE